MTRKICALFSFTIGLFLFSCVYALNIDDADLDNLSGVFEDRGVITIEGVVGYKESIAVDVLREGNDGARAFSTAQFILGSSGKIPVKVRFVAEGESADILPADYQIDVSSQTEFSDDRYVRNLSPYNSFFLLDSVGPFELIYGLQVEGLMSAVQPKRRVVVEVIYL